MYKEKKILALIPARGGSKGLPRKNIRPLAGRPLIAWSIEAAKRSSYLNDVVVITDDQEIASVANQYGAEVPFMEPAELATDTSHAMGAVLYTLDMLKAQGRQYDYVALLEPTSPLRKKDDVDNGIRALIDAPDMDALVSLGVIQLEHPRIAKRVMDGLVIPYADLPTFSQRQAADKAYFPYGVLYLARTEALYRDKTFYAPKLMPLYIERWQNYEIDDGLDFEIAELVMNKYKSLL